MSLIESETCFQGKKEKRIFYSLGKTVEGKTTVVGRPIEFSFFFLRQVKEGEFEVRPIEFSRDS